MRMKPQIRLCISLVVLLRAPAPAASSRQPGAREVYAGLPVEVQLLIADIKWDETFRNAAAEGNAAKVRSLQGAKASLKEALRKYEFFRTGDRSVLSEGWGFFWAPPRPDFPSVTKSPLSLLEHLRVGYDAVVQIRSGIMVAPVRYSAAESERHGALNGALDLINKTAEAVEATGVWIAHWLSDARVMISAPPEFKRAALMKGDLVRLVKSKPDGSPLAVVSVIRTYLDRDEMELRPEQYREKIIEKTRARFPDMSVAELGEIRAGAGATVGDFAASFAYQYAWEGAPIKALVHIRRDGSSAHEINFVSVASSFDRAEADSIIGSFLKR